MEGFAWEEDTYEKIKLISYWSFYRVERLRYCRSIVLDNLSAGLVKTKALPWYSDSKNHFNVWLL